MTHGEEVAEHEPPRYIFLRSDIPGTLYTKLQPPKLYIRASFAPFGHSLYRPAANREGDLELDEIRSNIKHLLGLS
jgi:hypothetical protein